MRKKSYNNKYFWFESLIIKRKELFKTNIPWGIILFRRNIKNYNQLKNLTHLLKNNKGQKIPHYD